MGDKTIISWTGHSWNPWWGCHEVTPGCAHCYARVIMEKFGRDFHVVKRTSDSTFYAPIKKWRDPAYVFTCSMGDFFHIDADQWRDEAWDIISATPHLTYQILTKRPERILSHLPRDWGEGWPNVWLGTTIENNRWVGRADILRAIPAVVHYLSCEPLLSGLPDLNLKHIEWVICGGESGKGFRPMDPQWARDLRDKCLREGVAYFYKQGNGIRSEMNKELDGRRWEQMPDGVAA
jgi:protein gp37